MNGWGFLYGTPVYHVEHPVQSLAPPPFTLYTLYCHASYKFNEIIWGIYRIFHKSHKFTECNPYKVRGLMIGWGV